MSIISTMYAGASGLNAHSDAMGVVSDNIANVNTFGFKKSRANFSDILGGTLRGRNVGQGAMVQSVQTNFLQGSFIGTGNTTDLAISGDGFFVVNGTFQGVNNSYYTRNGAFTLDENGFLQNGDGLRVQGYAADGNGGLLTAIGDMQIDTAAIAPSATNDLSIVANLDADQAVSGVAWDPANPGNTSDFSTSVTVYDSLGNEHQLEIYFQKTATTPNATWDYHVMAAGSELDPASANPLEELGTGTATFGTDGSLTSYDLNSVTANWLGADPATINLNFGSDTASGGSGVDGLTQYSLDSSVTFMSQNGYNSGDLAGLAIDDAGMLTGMYSNGEQRALGQLAMARFASNDGLTRQGSSLFAETRESGQAVVGAAGSGGRGSVLSGNLEASNVDLAQQFVEMISLQRGFQSNSRSITTADEMLGDVISLKR